MLVPQISPHLPPYALLACCGVLTTLVSAAPYVCTGVGNSISAVLFAPAEFTDDAHPAGLASASASAFFILPTLDVSSFFSSYIKHFCLKIFAAVAATFVTVLDASVVAVLDAAVTFVSDAASAQPSTPPSIPLLAHYDVFNYEKNVCRIPQIPRNMVFSEFCMRFF